ncbi:hypothetical protein CPB86DRAFT_152194 [Serendipita vermifera]|nr:hypothetical protein CPB86DRAFT_152194 [Serendipita vermifera]
MFQQHLQQFLKTIPLNSFGSEVFNQAAENLLAITGSLCSKDTLKPRWEVSIRAETLSLTQEETQVNDQPDQFYGRLFNILDLTMFLAEKEHAETSLPFTILRELFECLSIQSSGQVFSWVERRAKRLCIDPYRESGSNLPVLRILNDLLRNLSKSTETEFCARILVFMNDIFPYSERSGVNLRGEYGPSWEGPPSLAEGKELMLSEARQEDIRKNGSKDESGDVKMDDAQVESGPTDKRDLFYKTFWFLQYPFSRPPLFADAGMFIAFQHAVNNTLPILSEATKKERSLAGSKSLAGVKRKRDPMDRHDQRGQVVNEHHKEYAFAKYLSSPELLELEIADTNFRRQFLFQLLILLQYLKSFSEAEKKKTPPPKNRSLHIDFTLSEAEENWVKEMNGKVMLELRATSPDGRGFEEMIRVILDREQNWIKWKNLSCPPFQKGPVTQEIREETRTKRRALMTSPENWSHSHGTEALSEIWTMGYRSLDDIAIPRTAPEPASFLPRIQLVEKRISARKVAIERTIAPQPIPAETAKPVTESAAPQLAPPAHASLPPKPGTTTETRPSSAPISTANEKPSQPVDPLAAIRAKKFREDEKLQDLERQKQTYSWLALRSASRKYLHLFHKIGTGNVDKLVAEIKESEKVRAEKSVDISDILSEKGDLDASGDVEMTTQDSQVENSVAPAEKGDTTESTNLSVNGADSNVVPPPTGAGVPMEVDPSTAPLT